MFLLLLALVLFQVLAPSNDWARAITVVLATAALAAAVATSQDERRVRRVRALVVSGLGVLVVVGLAVGYGLGWLGVCPVVKRIWTPSWVLFSGGWCFLFLAGSYAAADLSGYGGWAFPLLVIGANSIAAYVMDWLFVGFIRDALKRHLGADTFRVLGPEYEPLLLGGAVLAVLWLILFWMYRRKLFLRI